MGWMTEFRVLGGGGINPRRKFAREDLAWDYPVSRSRVDSFYY